MTGAEVFRAARKMARAEGVDTNCAVWCELVAVLQNIHETLDAIDQYRKMRREMIEQSMRK